LRQPEKFFWRSFSKILTHLEHSEITRFLDSHSGLFPKKSNWGNLNLVCGQGEKVKKVEAFRRCHVCGKTSEVKGNMQMSLDRCLHCKKAFAPFYYYDDFSKPIFSEGLERPPLMIGEWPAIQGLTAYW
tara:strand:- start:248 stop:634 length:387 start_codon:yes stop_codon:yes gene_type:complete